MIPAGARRTIDDALEGIMALLKPGPYGFSEEDPKAVLIRDLGMVTAGLKVVPVIIGGVAVIVHGHQRQTVDVELLVARADALCLVRALEASPGFSKIRIDRFRHVASRAGLDLCVEGELTCPNRLDRFPSPAEVERLPAEPLPVVGLIDLLALKVKAARAQDEADFVRLYNDLGLGAGELERVRSRIQDPGLRETLDRWHRRAQEEMERERSRRPPKLD